MPLSIWSQKPVLYIYVEAMVRSSYGCGHFSPLEFIWHHLTDSDDYNPYEVCNLSNPFSLLLNPAKYYKN